MDDFYTRMASEVNIRLAVEFTLNDSKSDVFYNPIQIAHCMVNKDAYIKKVQKILIDPTCYCPKPAIRALKKKNEFSVRNFVILDIEDAIIRTAIAIVLANELEDRLIDNCFSSRRGDQVKENRSLVENFADHGWQDFCEWQEDNVKKKDLLLKTDISSFFDSISHELLIHAFINQLELSLDDPTIVLLKNALRVSHVFSNEDSPIEVKHGITIGTSANHIFANLFLNPVDHFMKSLPGIEYGRYVDDIRIFANDKRYIAHALNQLQMRLFEIGLNLNGAKTQYAGSKTLIKRLLAENLLTYFQEEGNYKLPTASKIVKIEKDLINYHRSKEKDIDKPFTDHCRDIDSWRGVKLSGHHKKTTEYLHTVQYTIEQDNTKITKNVVDKLFRILCECPANEKFACWLIVRIVIDFRFDKESRVKILDRVLGLIAKEKITSYTSMRFLLFLSRQYTHRFDYSVVNECLGSSLQNKFIDALNVRFSSSSLLSNIVALYAATCYNIFHNGESSIEIDTPDSARLIDVFRDNCYMIKELMNRKTTDKTDSIESVESVPENQ